MRRMHRARARTRQCTRLNRGGKQFRSSDEFPLATAAAGLIRAAVAYLENAHRRKAAALERSGLSVHTIEGGNACLIGQENIREARVVISGESRVKGDAGMKAKVDRNICSGCGACESLCPEGAVTVGDAAEVDEGLCTGCGKCVEVCPLEAISLQ